MTKMGTKLHLANAYVMTIREQLSKSLALEGEKYERFAALITAHTSADRMLTILLTMRLRRKGQSDEAVDRVFDVLAELGFGERIDLTESLQILSHSALQALRRLNIVRNHLLHAKRKRLDLDSVAEVQSPGAFSAIARDAVKALNALSSELKKPQVSLLDLMEGRG